MSTGQGHWRWNVNPTWEHYSSMFQECKEAMLAGNDFIKYHHIRACLYFGIGAIEAFLNERMRQKLKSGKTEEDDIFKKLRSTRFNIKLSIWPSEISGRKVVVPKDLMVLINVYSDLRGEVTHPKRKDHSIYKDLDNVNIDKMPSVVAEYIVSTLTACDETFPYWLLGWNYIGMGRDEGIPVLINNQQFLYSLGAFGFRVPTPIADEMKSWEQKNMSTVDGFRALQKALKSLNHCEFKVARFPHKPRLCRKWWDEKHITKCGIAS